MLKIKDNVSLEELEKYDVFPHYAVNEYTGETKIDSYETSRMYFKGLRFKKEKCRIALFNYKGYMIDPKAFMELNCDLLYDLIKADLVEKVGE